MIMPETKAKAEFVDCVVELMQMIGPVTVKRMFSGSGLFLDGIYVVDSTFYLKADAKTEDGFKDQRS